MPYCPRCGANVPGAARFCPACGAEQSSASLMPTAVAARSAPRAAMPSAPIGRLDPSSLSESAFTPGEVVADRYRIIGLLGRGGMGEIYRADDLKLAQPVALKFLPPGFSRHPHLLGVLHQEVRNARQVSHPNVCRVYDIGETQGRPFLTMEYVDGEDLATLLRRIGRLPQAKADEIAQQLCAGLAAAHDRGVLHRDLKPSNIMIDGNGRARITDFGLAIRSDEATAGELAGTPAYMAPEQFQGGAVTERSDLYALGLVLYEIYTGRRPFEAASVADWKDRHTHAEPKPPSQADGGIDEVVERAILRCLEKDPARRPASALQLASALPGGNPLAAALAAGETPSPEMVAAAGGEGASTPRAAWSRLLGVIATLIGLAAVAPYSSDLGLARLTNGADVLRGRARATLQRFGYDKHALDSDGWFARDYGTMSYLSRHTPSTQWRPRMRGLGAPVQFVYRQSPRWMVTAIEDNRLTETEPPHEVSGMAGVILDANGGLRALRAVPPQLDSTTAATPPASRPAAAVPASSPATAPDSMGPIAPDWSPLFQEAGLDAANFRRVPPRWVSPEPFDTRAEWVGPAPGLPGIPLTVAAAAYRGRPVYFEVLGPWSRPLRMQPPSPAMSLRVAQNTAAVAGLLLITAGVFFARRNLKLGRGDRRGGMRLAGFILWTRMLSWAAGAHHVSDLPAEFELYLLGFARALSFAAFAALLYLALEPYVRRRMPELLIGWTRLLDGRWRDPRVGRDVLVGALAGSIMALGLHVTNALPAWIPFPGQTTLFPNYDAVYGGRRLVSFLLAMPVNVLLPSMFLFCALFVLRVVLRRPALTVTGLMLLATLLSLGGENVTLETPDAAIAGVLTGLLAARFGLLALVAGELFRLTLTLMPLPLGADLPYAASSAAILLVLLALAGYAFRISLGSRRLVSIED